MTVLTPDLPQTEIAIVELTNAFRRENKLGEVRRAPLLDAAARAYARYLIETGRFSHTADGKSPWDRTGTAGYKHCFVAENLARFENSRGFETRELGREMLEGWKRSPPHRKALMERDVTEIGIAVAKADGRQSYVSVQLLARPESLKYTFEIRNAASADVRYTFAGERHELKRRQIVRHTACLPGELAVEGAGFSPLGGRVGSSYAARNGDLFLVREDARGRLIVDVKPATQ